jgi:hypothetical protein
LTEEEANRVADGFTDYFEYFQNPGSKEMCEDGSVYQEPEGFFKSLDELEIRINNNSWMEREKTRELEMLCYTFPHVERAILNDIYEEYKNESFSAINALVVSLYSEQQVPADLVPADQVPADQVPADQVLADQVLVQCPNAIENAI